MKFHLSNNVFISKSGNGVLIEKVDQDENVAFSTHIDMDSFLSATATVTGKDFQQVKEFFEGGQE